MDVVPVVETAEERLMGILGWILAVVLVAFMLPLLAFLYLSVWLFLLAYWLRLEFLFEF